MTILSNIVTTIYKKIDGANKQCAMEKGYPLSIIPFTPKIMEQEFHKKILSNSLNTPKVMLVMAPEGCDLVDPKSLKFIQDQLCAAYQDQPCIMKELEDPIPTNTIAVSFPMFNFRVEDTCYEFCPLNRLNIPRHAYLTYQLQSENLQLTYYNEHGVEYLAGVTFFPVLIGRAKCIENDNAALRIATGIAEPYPLQDRNQWAKKVRQHMYGRFCSRVGKRILIDCRDIYVRHWEFNHITREWTKDPCEECLVDSLTYKFVNPGTEAAEKQAKCDQSLDSQIQQRLEQLTANGEISVHFSHRETGELLEIEKWPKLTELTGWIAANPEYSVHCPSDLFMKLLVGNVQQKIGMTADKACQCDYLSFPIECTTPTMGRSTASTSMESLMEDFDVVSIASSEA